jgi:hypothetical protein
MKSGSRNASRKQSQSAVAGFRDPKTGTSANVKISGQTHSENNRGNILPLGDDTIPSTTSSQRVFSV